jgi:hypothetical protein
VPGVPPVTAELEPPVPLTGTPPEPPVAGPPSWLSAEQPTPLEVMLNRPKSNVGTGRHFVFMDFAFGTQKPDPNENSSKK